MNRRDFIQVLGVGSGAVVVPSALTGCSTLRSVDAWNGPDHNLDDIRWHTLSFAILAANPHNKQPWLIKLTGPRSFDLYVDQSRLLPETDPPSRQIHIGQGTFLENLAVAAQALGHRADIEYFPQGMYGNDVIENKPVASISLTEDANVSRDPLFDAITKRQSNKRQFEKTPLSTDQLSGIQSAYDTAEYPLTVTSDPEQRRKLAEILTEAMRIEISNKQRHSETIAMFRFNDTEMERHRDGFGVAQSGTTGMGKFFVETFILSSREDSLPADSSFGTATIDLTAGQSESAPAFGWITSTANTRLDQVKVGRAYERVNLTATALGLAQHPMSQVLQEYSDMFALRQELHTFLKIPEGHTLQMLFRLGQAEPVVHSPRRRLEDLMPDAS